MGICISVASKEIHDAEDGHENVIFFQGNNVSNGALGLGSLYSKQGSKGLNQDAVILYQVLFHGSLKLYLWSLVLQFVLKLELKLVLILMRKVNFSI